MMITSMLVLFQLLIILIAGIIPFSGCLHYLEANQLIYDANQLTVFPLMEISAERHFQAICEIMFFCQ